MNPWPFVWGAYAFAILGMIALTLSSWAEMRRAEAEADKLGGRS